MASPDVRQAVGGGRQIHLDWLRGVAVVIMILGHALDAWTRPSDRGLRLFGWGMVLAGGGSALFLFLAGVASTLAAETRARRLGDSDGAAASVRKRGGQIFLYAFLFRLQSFLLSPGSSWGGLLKVDILNVMGPSISAVATLWQLAPRAASRLTVLSGATAAIVLMTPLVRAATWPALLPDPIEWYLRPFPGRTNFTLLPWAGYVTAGGVVGVWLNRMREPLQQTRAHVLLAGTGLALALAGLGGSYLPSIYAATSFWTTSPAFFCLRAGLLIVGVSVAFAWVRARGGKIAQGPLCRLGLSSLFVYWIHVEMVFGALSTPLHRRLSLPMTFVAIALFTGLMLMAVALKERGVRWWRTRPPRSPGVSHVTG
jgi:uncharacterized membrane protein